MSKLSWNLLNQKFFRRIDCSQIIHPVIPKQEQSEAVYLKQSKKTQMGEQSVDKEISQNSNLEINQKCVCVLDDDFFFF